MYCNREFGGGGGVSSGEMRSSAHTEVATLHLASSLLSIQALRHISTNVELLCLLLCSCRYRGTRTHLGPSASDRLCESERVYLTCQLAGCNDSPPTLSLTKILTFRPPLWLIAVYRRTNSSTKLQWNIFRCHVFVCVCYFSVGCFF